MLLLISPLFLLAIPTPTPSYEPTQIIDISNLATKQDIQNLQQVFIQNAGGFTQVRDVLMSQTNLAPLLIVGIGIVINAILLYFITGRMVNRIRKLLEENQKPAWHNHIEPLVQRPSVPLNKNYESYEEEQQSRQQPRKQSTISKIVRKVTGMPKNREPAPAFPAPTYSDQQIQYAEPQYDEPEAPPSATEVSYEIESITPNRIVLKTKPVASKRGVRR
jgi:hypothetical protein